MKGIYSPPESDLTNQKTVSSEEFVRPRVVTTIATIYFVVALMDLIYRIYAGFLTETVSLDASGNDLKTSVNIQLLWLVLYGVGAGLMRRGKFARGFACFLGLFAFIVPGILFIYYLYFSEAKYYFNDKPCPKCGGEKWKNVGFGFKKQSCKKCKHAVSLKNT